VAVLLALVAGGAQAARGDVALVSRASGANGAKGDDASFSPSLSADGRFVAFESNASNLSPDDVLGRPRARGRESASRIRMRVSL
jgi:hypothetical protein